jgi:acyl-coenzyme A synthetase/AMP-(fatty) acid ligase
VSAFPSWFYTISSDLSISLSEFTYDESDEASLAKELTLQVRKTIGPFAAPKKIFIVSDLPKTRSGKVRRRLVYFRLSVVS